jgi:chromosome segregation protein
MYLKSLEMVGFKSFAEARIEFPNGVTAIVGPNGSGKSNLADALRWALGEQGRALRTRRAEDLIFAGSASRKAVGMADVSVLIDNEDRLLGVDYGEVELSRRLYRSGENEYLINRERIRLRDLVDLLDDANIADNAFLFIGQGMVDQALALRPEERRPLFEEAAGIRKHERRRRKAEADLAEASANLERVRDLLAELRPQARRLQAQAEQQEARAEAGAQLAAALVGVARDRIATGTREAALHAAALGAARRDADDALAALRDTEETATGLARALSERADAEARLRHELDEARRGVQEARLAQTRLDSEAEAVDRERGRIGEERTATQTRIEEARGVLAATLPDVDPGADVRLEQAERRLADAMRDADALRDAGQADAERAVSARAARARLAADADRAARRAAETARRLDEQRTLVAEAEAAATTQGARAEAARETAAAALEAESVAERVAGAARSAVDESRARLAAARDVEERLRAAGAALEARRSSLVEELTSDPDRAVVDSVRARGGRPLIEGLEVEPGVRTVLEAALGEALSGLVLDPAGAGTFEMVPSVIVLGEAQPARRPAADRAADRLIAAVEAADGGSFEAGLRRDPDGHAARLVARSRWVPDLETALRLRELLPPGWRLVTRDGVVLDDLGVLRPAPRTSALDRRAALEDVEARSRSSRAASTEAERRTAEAVTAAGEAALSLEVAQAGLEVARRARRVADDEERAAATAAGDAARDRAWQAALLDRAETEEQAVRTETAARQEELELFDAAASDAAAQGGPGGSARTADLRALDERVAILRSERDAAARAATDARADHDRAVEQRRRAEIGVSLAQARIDELARDLAALGAREADLAAGRDRVAADLAAARTLEQGREDAFDASVASARDERQRLLESEAGAATARERLRAAESRSRQSEVAEMEARLQLEAAREGLLVELASIGRDGLAALLGESGSSLTHDPVDGETLPTLLEEALETAIGAWQQQVDASAAEPSHAATEPPSRARLAALRRRFNELGASNPFAAAELAEVRVRLDALEVQREDLESAIRDTRELIGRLEELMTEQFRQTFAALEDAFGRRFGQLFGGGEAQLSLTEPDDLSTTGVEITARPPGKKRQPLAMLSGGERALTAVALLLAMLEVRPVPFCVLDEVDAALDEANIGRFSTALRSLAEDIQFVVITHNRGTIETADALYGVTVGDDAISHVISLRLADLPAREAVAVPVGA